MEQGQREAAERWPLQVYPTPRVCLPTGRWRSTQALHTRLVWYHPLAAGVGTVNTEAIVVMTGGLQRSKCHFLLLGRGVSCQVGSI